MFDRVHRLKSKIMQFFCRHKHVVEYKKASKSGFAAISGETHLRVCKDCGKVISEQFYQYEGMGFK